jgi:hypothetical protein
LESSIANPVEARRESKPLFVWLHDTSKYEISPCPKTYNPL